MTRGGLSGLVSDAEPDSPIPLPLTGYRDSFSDSLVLLSNRREVC